MFNKQNFCHVASNNRNEQKAGIFVYKTTDNVATVSASGYFNEKIIDINLHDFIIHEWHDPIDRTKVEYNLLCVVERTLENVGTSVIKTKWEKDVDALIAQIQTDLSGKVNIDGSSIMTGPLKMRSSISFKCAIAPSWDGVGFYKLNDNDSLTLLASMEATDGLTPAQNNTYNIGKTSHKWKTLYIGALNNGYDIAVPVTAQAETLALKSEVDLAANSGRMITEQGVWYAKMDAAGTIPAEAEVEGRNYADFTQVDVDNNPIIVIYTYTSGAWTQTETITPPAAYDGYVPVTSKIWDIPEQTGQQGGRILWNHQSKEFTPYPLIVSFEDINITGNSTVAIPATPSNTQIVNKQYVDNAIAASGSGKTVGEIFFTTRNDTLQGAVECDGGTYNTGDFSGAQTIGQLLEDGKVPYVSLAQYTTLLSTNGSVGVFGWDGAGTTAFRVPTLTDIFVETGTAAQIGDYIAPGAPNITFDATGLVRNGTGALTTGTNTTNYFGPATSNNVYEKNLSFSATNSNAIYGNSNTIQPNAVRYRPMIQLAISATDEAVITCTAITSDVAAMKSHEVIEFQAPTAQNDYTWYRKYADGWVEQGGIIPVNISSVTLPVEMADANYMFQVSGYKRSDTNTMTWNYISSNTQTTTGFTIASSSGGSRCWEVKGMAAQ